MEKLTYKQAYDKIIEAYFKDEIKPLKPKFCFCGTLCDNSTLWHGSTFDRKHNDYGEYSGVEYVRMERALIDAFYMRDGDCCDKYCPNYEDNLFKGLCAALEVLKQIHEERGEDVDGVQEFTKRELVK